MPPFEYRARDRSGRAVAGVIEAPGPADAAQELDRLGYIPTSILPHDPGSVSTTALAKLRERFSRVSPEDFILYNRQLSTLVSSGVPFLRALDAVAEQTRSPRLRGILEQVRGDIESGSSFSAALARHPDQFSELYRSMIRVGEEGGMLDRVLDRLASLAEREAVIRARISAAMRYPIIVTFALIAAIVALMHFVVPQFARLYERFEGELPLPTRVLIAANHLFQNYWLLGAGLAVAAALAVRAALRTPAGRDWWDGVRIRIPVFGPLLLKATMARFSRVFSALLRSGIPILRTIEIAAETAGNRVVRRVILDIGEHVREGQSISGPMRRSPVFPPVVVQMVAIGEETGKLDDMLEKVAEYFETEVEYAIRNLTTAIEPMLIVVIGGIVLFLALAIFLPWWNVITLIPR